MKIDIRLDGEERVRDAFNRLIKASSDLGPVMRDLGEELTTTTRQRFVDQEGPDGKKWAPLTETTKKRKKRNRDKVLTESGHLSGSINYRAASGHVLIGSTRIYAGTHQFGAKKGSFGSHQFSAIAGPFKGTTYKNLIPWGDIPARPFLGLSDKDRDLVLEVLETHLARAAG